MDIGTKYFDLKVDVKRFVSLNKTLVKGHTVEDEVNALFMSFCLAEVCWKFFCKNHSCDTANLGEFRSELRIAAVKLVEELFKE